MVKVRWTPQAADDLDTVAEFIGKDSEHYASLFVMDVLEVVERLIQVPVIESMII